MSLSSESVLCDSNINLSMVNKCMYPLEFLSDD